MIDLPRLGLAISGAGPEPSVAGLALLAGLTSKRVRVQHFRAKACPMRTGLIRQFTGIPGRHLDAWLMPPDVCRAVFIRGARHGDIAVVEGTFDQPSRSLAPCDYLHPGGLAPIAEALDLPMIAVVSVPREGDFHLPSLPPKVDAILLDGLANPGEFEHYRHLVATLTRKPVIGGVESFPAISQVLSNLSPQDTLPDEFVATLAASFLRYSNLEQINDLARSRQITPVCCKGGMSERPNVRVAYAQDEAFGGYFPDTLETLEVLGAELIDFSPLRDEALPKNVDLVMIGCGVADQFAETLSANHCMISALKAYVCQGRRIYSEGSGTAYLGRAMIIAGQYIPGAGILPIISELRDDPTQPIPVERVLTRNGWLGLEGTLVRGYRSGRWKIQEADIDTHCRNSFGEFATEGDMVFHHHAVGSLIHLHLGALPEVVSAFLGPHRPSLTLPQLPNKY
jgi:cobyrinic acid a,c-diamide synthase